MAGPNEIQVGRFNRFVQKFLGIKGPPPMPSVASDLQLIYEFESGIDTAYLEGWDTFFAYLSFTPSAGNAARAEIRNPLGSNAAVYIEKVCAVSGAAAEAITISEVRGATTDQAGPAAGFSMDPRSKPRSVCITSANNAAAKVAMGGASNVYEVKNTTAANVNVELTQFGEQLLLMPGDAWAVDTSALAASVAVSYRWRERFLEQDERS